MPRPGGSPTPLYHAYCAFTAIASPFVWRTVRGKLASAGVTPERQRERLGHATQPRPKGRLIWFHAASVGESLSVLTLIRRMGEALPDASFLITSGTPTSAELVAKRLPERTRHQFAPLDTGAAVGRFLKHWQPDAGIFVESEMWPRVLVEAKARGVALALLNARLSRKSLGGWKKFPKTARFILAQFSLFVTQNRDMAEALVAIGADPDLVRPGTNLKATSAPLPVDDETLSQIRGDLAGRRLWVASSTHAGEEETVLRAHRHLLSQFPDLLLLLIPRHPERGDEVAGLIEKAGLSHARRSVGQRIEQQTQVYLADTLGETGTWYALCPLVFLGGSLLEIGGHNPFEPAQSGAAVLTGPGYFNFSETFAPMIASGAVREIDDAETLANGIAHWLNDPAALQMARDAGFDNVNLDLMFGLPGQTVAGALAELDQAIALDAPHLSWYQLTLEPNTAFALNPPSGLPDDDTLSDMQIEGISRLADSGYHRYEVSAFAQAQRECQHNLNYWRFGDYLGVGAGAHGKWTHPDGSVERSWKTRHPKAYQAQDHRSAERHRVDAAQVPFEFMLNALRLVDGVEIELFERTTGNSVERLTSTWQGLVDRRLVHPIDGGRLKCTDLGFRWLNDVVGAFLPE